MNNRIEIRLAGINDQSIGLEAMDSDAMQSFILAVSSLKSIAENVVGKQVLTFSIQEGSAVCSVEAPPESLEIIYGEIDAAIQGESLNKGVTDGLRQIQHEIKRTDIALEFRYRRSSTVVDMHGRLKSANRIGLKRVRSTSKYKLLASEGKINLIGGENPNYHIDYGHGDKKTIDCSESEAIQIKQFLYENCNPLVLCKVFEMPNKKNEYFHLTMVDDEIAETFRRFVTGYNEHDDIIGLLGNTYDFMDYVFQNTKLGHKILRTLLLGFNNKRFQLGEIKTILVISKPFKNHDLIREPRQALLDMYNAIRK